MRTLTRDQITREFFLPVKTLETWVRRGLLTPVTRGRYLEDDVAAVEASTRRRPRLDRLVALAACEGPPDLAIRGGLPVT